MTEKTTLAFTGIPDFAKYQATEQDEQNVNLESGTAFPFLAFFHHNMVRQAEIREQIKNIKDGDPFVRVGDRYIRLGRYAVFANRGHEYWAELDGDNRIVEVTFDFPGKDSDMKQAVLAETYVYDPSLVDEIGVAFLPGVTTFKTTKVSGIKSLMSMVRDTKKPDWIKDRPVRQQLVQNGVPPYLRVAAEFTLKSQNSRATGRTYQTVEAASVDDDTLLRGLSAVMKYDEYIQKRKAELDRTDLDDKTREKLESDPVPTMDEVKDAFDKRLAWLQSKVRKADKKAS